MNLDYIRRLLSEHPAVIINACHVTILERGGGRLRLEVEMEDRPESTLLLMNDTITQAAFSDRWPVWPQEERER